MVSATSAPAFHPPKFSPPLSSSTERASDTRLLFLLLLLLLLLASSWFQTGRRSVRSFQTATRTGPKTPSQKRYRHQRAGVAIDVDFPRLNRPGSTEEGAGKRLSKKEKKKKKKKREKKKKSRRNGVCAFSSLLSRVFCFASLSQTTPEEENKKKWAKP